MVKTRYKQSKEHTNKINTPERAKKISESLKRLYMEGKRVSWTKGKSLTKEHRESISNGSKRGKENPAWCGENPTYAAAHLWIKKYYGKANSCQNYEEKVLDFDCSKKSKVFQWAKRKGHRYSRDINDYYQLCVSCHSRYDAPQMKLCKLDKCDKKRRRYGYCEKHGIRFKKWGNPLAVKPHHNQIKLLDK